MDQTVDEVTAGLIIGVGSVAGTIMVTLIQRNHQKKVAKDNMEIARANLKKDLRLHYDEIKNERDSKAFDYQMQFLREIHVDLSHINFDYSTTGDCIHASSETGLDDHHRNYIQNVRSLDKVQATVDINYPQISAKIHKIKGQANLYWGHRREVIIGDRGESQTDENHWRIPQLEIQKACDNIAELVGDIHREISKIAEDLRENFCTVQLDEPKDLDAEVILPSILWRSWWALLLGSLFGVLLLAPESNFAIRLREIFYTLQDSTVSILDTLF